MQSCLGATAGSSSRFNKGNFQNEERVGSDESEVQADNCGVACNKLWVYG